MHEICLCEKYPLLWSSSFRHRLILLCHTIKSVVYTEFWNGKHWSTSCTATTKILEWDAKSVYLSLKSYLQPMRPTILCMALVSNCCNVSIKLACTYQTCIQVQSCQCRFLNAQSLSRACLILVKILVLQYIQKLMLKDNDEPENATMWFLIHTPIF